MKFLESQFEEYINSVNANNLHPELNQIINLLPNNINLMPNLIYKKSSFKKRVFLENYFSFRFLSKRLILKESLFRKPFLIQFPFKQAHVEKKVRLESLF